MVRQNSGRVSLDVKQSVVSRAGLRWPFRDGEVAAPLSGDLPDQPSATGQGGGPTLVSGDLFPTDLASLLNGLAAIYRWLNPAP